MKRVAGLLGFFVLTAVTRKVMRSKLVTAVCYVLVSDWLLMHEPPRRRRRWRK